ncbi:hypothetical protein Dda_1357 [Drechslerella dactyloides]|uniref:Uncharacterized protein n=1 Tax=Drechslerella dactyloides TaxID=74499 RepID=A0AAD6J3Y8_DREDA|nr:hypothetical protein Dda_1357 [Drechslerella dactyloides]
MSFLRALSSDSLSGSSKSVSAQASQPGPNASFTSHQNSHQQNHNSASTGGSHRRHHAKALLHPMSLLLRRRSGQSNSSSEPPSGMYGGARELPEDFDPGIIYGTRHPDWSFPRRSTTQPVNSIIHTKNGVQGRLPNSTGDGPLRQTKDARPDNTYSRKRQALFTEHFSDLETSSSTPNQSDKVPARPQYDSSDATGQRHTFDTHDAPRTLVQASIEDTHPQSSSYGTTVNNGINGRDSSTQTGNRKDPTDVQQSEPEEQSHISSQHSEAPLDSLQNSSRFSFEASSAADSVPNEELTLSENLIKDSRSQSTDTESFRSDDLQSITSEDLRDEAGDGFDIPYTEYSHNIAPPPGFENVVVDTAENTRRLQQIELDEQLEVSTRAESSDVESVVSSEIGTNGSITGEEEEEEEEEREKSTKRGGEPCPPFVNPSGPGVQCDGILGHNIHGNHGSDNLNPDRVQNSSLLLFQNVFQTEAHGVNEYDTGSPSSFLGFQPLGHTPYNHNPVDYEVDDGDEDDMIAEANRDVLASDNDGWYGQEFNFYPTSSTDSTYLAGGFFGIDLPKPGFIRNPSLTPISERSEGSLRNSLSIINPNSIPHTGISAGPLSAALFTELANDEQISCDEATLTQLQLLNGAKNHEESLKYLAMIASSPSTASVVVNATDGPLFTTSNSASIVEQSRSPLIALDDLGNYHAADISTSYVHDIDLGWVMEKRRGGELIQRELVQGAV